MRDDRNKWQAPDWQGQEIIGPGVRIAPIALSRQTLISGAGVGKGALGWPEVATGAQYRLCLRRDRVLEVGSAPVVEGWDAARGLAVTDISFASEVLEITGENAFSVLQSGTEINRAVASRSVSRLFAGHAVLLYAWGDRNSFRLHVAAPEMQALWQFLQASVAAL